jgi:hypothetical protein
MAGGEKNVVTDAELRAAVVRTETQIQHMTDTVDKLAKTVEQHVSKTSESVRDLHVKIDAHAEKSEKKYVSKETHAAALGPIRTVLKTMTVSLIGLATGAVSYLLYGRS